MVWWPHEPRRALRAGRGPAKHRRRQDRHLMAMAPRRQPEEAMPVSARERAILFGPMAEREIAAVPDPFMPSQQPGPGHLDRSIAPPSRASHDPADHAAPRNTHSTAPDRGFPPRRLSDAGPRGSPSTLRKGPHLRPFTRADVGSLPESGHSVSKASAAERRPADQSPGTEEPRAFAWMTNQGHKSIGFPSEPCYLTKPPALPKPSMWRCRRAVRN